MEASFPQYVVLKSRYNKEYLGYVKEEGQVQGFLRFGKAEFTSPLSKFQVEWAESDPKLVHLKSCYNNRYLAAQHQSSTWIVAEADKPEEDQSKWSCTLFQPVPYSDYGDDFRFKHVKTGNFAVLMRQSGVASNNCLYAGWPEPNSDLCDVVTVIDWRSLLVLPKYMVLKSNYNGKYLEYVEEDEKVQGYLRFSREGYRSLLSKFEVEWAGSDSQLVHLKSCYNNKYLTVKSETSNWIAAEADKPEENQSKWSCTLFQPVPFSADKHDFRFRFKHVKTGHYAVLLREKSGNPFADTLYAGWQDPNSDLCDVVTVIDWTSLVVLPKYVVLKSNYNHKYLEYVNKEGKVKGYLRFTKDDFTSPLSKFEVELGRSDSQLVHLKSCYTNEYLRAESQASNWIAAEADKPEEDQSKWSCTLFEPVPFSDGEGDFRFKHVKTGHYAVLMRKASGDALNNCLYAGWPDPNSDLCDVVTVIDWTSLVVLPKYVAFKGSNGNYLSGRILDDGKHYLQFSSSDITDKTAAHEVFQNPDGSIRLKSTHFDQFWRSEPSWILADSDNTSTTDKNTLFWPVKVDRNIIALRSLGNDRFCKNFTLNAISNCLRACDSIISIYSQLQVTDLAHSREMNDIELDVTRARKYDEQVGVMSAGESSDTT